ncbi:MAG: lactonase family protein, partial [Candidatus Hydrogenedentes bacterium]|nr:lactonase family protein [Candidatus Hydrogenedentota bacterium]
NQKPFLLKVLFCETEKGLAMEIHFNCVKTFILAIACVLLLPAVSSATEYWVYFVSLQNGIHVSSFDAATGAVTDPVLAAPEAKGMNFIAIHPDGRHLYTCKRDKSVAGTAVAYAIDTHSGKLKMINESSAKGGPAHISLDATGHMAVLANYANGSISSMPIKSDGSLGDVMSFFQETGGSVNPTRQLAPHPHSTTFSKDNRFAVVDDLGQDKLLVYRTDIASGDLTPHDPPFFKMKPGSGPRHMVFYPSGDYAYVINELACTVTVLAYDQKLGTFSEKQTVSTLPEGYAGVNTSAEIAIHPSGRFLYASNRGQDTIAVFRVDKHGERLTPVERVSTQGQCPRNFCLDPEGNYLFAANQNSDTVVVFRIDTKTGRLTPTGRALNVPVPMCVNFVERRR